jgi:Flp pilus assembly protein CpaB
MEYNGASIMRKIFLIIGAILGIIVAAGIFLFLQFTRPTVVEVPVAVKDIPAGTVLRPNLFRVARFSNVDSDSVAKWVTLATWKQAEGKLATSDIRAGFPLAKAQVDPNSPAGIETRLSLALSGTNDLYVVIPAAPDEAGNYVQPGDRVDLIVSIGGAPTDEMVLPQPTPEADAVEVAATTATTGVLTQTMQMPISKLVMQNMLVLRVDRQQVREQTSNNQQNQNQNSEQQRTTQQPQLGDVKRLYVQVNHDQLEILSFALNNGKHNIAVRAMNGAKDVLVTDGVTWDDFVRWFYAQRDNRADGAQPFMAVSPVQQGNTDK